MRDGRGGTAAEGIVRGSALHFLCNNATFRVSGGIFAADKLYNVDIYSLGYTQTQWDILFKIEEGNPLENTLEINIRMLMITKPPLSLVAETRSGILLKSN